MILAQDLKRMLPDWYEGIYETNLIIDIEQSQFDELATNINRAQSNMFVSTADSDTIRIYEAMLKISPNPSDTLQARRFRVLTRLASQKPYTNRYLEEMLSAFGSPVNVDYFYDEYRIAINSNFEKVGQIPDLEYLIRTIVPANILAEISNRLELNDLIEQIFLASSVTVCELVSITHDFAEKGNVSQSVFIAGGKVDTELQSITHDFKDSEQLQSTQYVATAQTQAEFQTLSHDFSQQIESKQNMVQSAGNVSAEFITINEESE
ncbi:putative phage tail protein [Enterococcus italicus]|uniref:putative phage tail protein n=1 Tax=Enterococcus italicus TaxID=246144 RepID=UPI00207309AD|nr:putative phage tail protein [Enterococcus italicus]